MGGRDVGEGHGKNEIKARATEEREREFLQLPQILMLSFCGWNFMCVWFFFCVSGVHSEPGLEWPEVSAAAVLPDPENGGQRARYPAVQVRNEIRFRKENKQKSDSEG